MTTVRNAATTMGGRKEGRKKNYDFIILPFKEDDICIHMDLNERNRPQDQPNVEFPQLNNLFSVAGGHQYVSVRRLILYRGDDDRQKIVNPKEDYLTESEICNELTNNLIPMPKYIITNCGITSEILHTLISQRTLDTLWSHPPVPPKIILWTFNYSVREELVILFREIVQYNKYNAKETYRLPKKAISRVKRTHARIPTINNAHNVKVYPIINVTLSNLHQIHDEIGKIVKKIIN